MTKADELVKKLAKTEAQEMSPPPAAVAQRVERAARIRQRVVQAACLPALRDLGRRCAGEPNVGWASAPNGARHAVDQSSPPGMSPPRKLLKFANGSRRRTIQSSLPSTPCFR